MAVVESTSRAISQAGLRAHVAANGYVLLPGLAQGVSTERIAADLGDPMAPWGGGVVQELTPREVSTPNTYSGMFGMGRFPFHTDLAHWPLPPRYLMLRCVRGYVDVPTLLLDGHRIATSVGDSMMRRALVRPRRPRDGEIRMLRLIQTEDAGEIVRWDEAFLLPASPVAKSAFSRFRDLLGMAPPLAPLWWTMATSWLSTTGVCSTPGRRFRRNGVIGDWNGCI